MKFCGKILVAGKGKSRLFTAWKRSCLKTPFGGKKHLDWMLCGGNLLNLYVNVAFRNIFEIPLGFRNYCLGFGSAGNTAPPATIKPASSSQNLDVQINPFESPRLIVFRPFNSISILWAKKARVLFGRFMGRVVGGWKKTASKVWRRAGGEIVGMPVFILRAAAGIVKRNCLPKFIWEMRAGMGLENIANAQLRRKSLLQSTRGGKAFENVCFSFLWHIKPVAYALINLISVPWIQKLSFSSSALKISNGPFPDAHWKIKMGECCVSFKIGMEKKTENIKTRCSKGKKIVRAQLCKRRLSAKINYTNLSSLHPPPEQ